MNFGARAELPELMDADDLPAGVYAAVVAELARVNTITRARPPTLAWLARATRGRAGFSLVDVGFGHGDMLRAIAVWARRRGLRAELTGIDLNPRSAPAAIAATDPALGIRWLTGDAAALAGSPDFIVSSLVAHHMGDAELSGFLRWMEATARLGWFVNDLHRHWLAWAGFRALGAVLRWHPIVRHDGALSVRRAFVRGDWERLLGAAGLAGVPVEVRWHLPFRWGVGRMMDPASTALRDRSLKPAIGSRAQPCPGYPWKNARDGICSTRHRPGRAFFDGSPSPEALA